jgi:hypothetical protein
MAPIDRSCSSTTLQPTSNMYIEKFNISWVSLCITDVVASVENTWQIPSLRDLFRISYIIGANDFGRAESSRSDGSRSTAVGENDQPGMGSWERGMIHPSLESWDPQLSIDPTSVLHSTYYVPSFIRKPLRARICIVKIKACINPYYSYGPHTYKLTVKAEWSFLSMISVRVVDLTVKRFKNNFF